MMELLIKLGGHWIFQSMLYMDHTERRFKLVLDILLTVLLTTLLSLFWPWPIAMVAGLLLAHTMNFVFNAQICALAANYSLVHTSYEEFTACARALAERAEQEPAVEYIAFCGSLAADAWHAEADLDVRVLRRPGLINGLRAGWFVLRERTRALFAWFPLDIYLFDSEETLRSKLRTKETLTVMP